MKLAHIPIGWFRSEHYEQFLELFEKTSNLPPTYELWLEQTEKTVESFRKNHVISHKIEVTPEEFRAWCQVRGVKMNNEACRTFTRECMVRMLEESERFRGDSSPQ